MSDGTKALVGRLRSRAWEHRNHRALRAEAADTIERLERDRDALAERCEKLREALRRNAVKDGYCAECSERPDWRTWVGTNPERHAPGCLAAQKDAP